MANPNVSQGVLSKIIASVAVIDSPELNATAPFLGPEGVSLTLQGEAAGYLPTLTGAVPSPNPYRMAELSICLLKTQGLSDAWKNREETSVLLGDVVVTPDAATLSTYYLVNCVIQGVNELTLNGSTPVYMVRVMGTWNINSDLFN